MRTTKLPHALNEKAFRAKEGMRKRLFALSFDQKVKILEKLRERDKVIAASGLRQRKDVGQKVKK